MKRVLVFGLGITGRATVRALRARDIEVMATADRLGTDERDELVAQGADVVDPTDLETLAAAADAVIPAPGVPETHPIVEAARATGTPLRGELEVAYELEQERPGGPRPIVAITGTDGKTTTTLLTTEILRAAGWQPVACGNTETPLIEAIDTDADVFVVEATSFRLAWTDHFRTEGAVWLNLAPDHLNWHATMTTYERAKAQLFEQQHADDVAVGFVDDPVVMKHLRSAPGRQRTFGLTGADYHVARGTLTGPGGAICPTSIMRRRLPHDMTNALAAAALVLETGLASATAIESALHTFTGPPHRLELIGERDDVAWYDDSKATTPHAASVALRAFESIVLIAGGSDKGLDLAPMAAEAARLRTVVAIGADTTVVESTFSRRVDVERAGSMAEAVELAGKRAQPGDVVLLSPGFASFDWYSGYEARGDDFRERVLARLEHTGREER